MVTMTFNEFMADLEMSNVHTSMYIHTYTMYYIPYTDTNRQLDIYTAGFAIGDDDA